MKNKLKFRTEETNLSIEQYKRYFSTLKSFRWHAEGGFCDVYYSPKTNRVIKIGKLNEDNYFQYIKRIGLLSPNPHFPTIYSVKVFDHNKNDPYSVPYYVVEMERLHEQYDLIDALRLAGNLELTNTVNAYFENLGLTDVYDFDNYRIHMSHPNTKYMKEVQNILLDLYSQGADADLRDRNVMWRIHPVTKHYDAVFTDPIV